MKEDKDFPNDPLRPYKMYVAMGAVLVSQLAAEAGLELNPYVKMVLIALVAGLAVYFTPNPEKPE